MTPLRQRGRYYKKGLSSILELNMVLASIIHHAVKLSDTTGGTIFEFEESGQVFVPRITYGLSNTIASKINSTAFRLVP